MQRYICCFVKNYYNTPEALASKRKDSQTVCEFFTRDGEVYDVMEAVRSRCSHPAGERRIIVRHTREIGSESLSAMCSIFPLGGQEEATLTQLRHSCSLAHKAVMLLDYIPYLSNDVRRLIKQTIARRVRKESKIRL